MKRITYAESDAVPAVGELVEVDGKKLRVVSRLWSVGYSFGDRENYVIVFCRAPKRPLPRRAA